MGQRLLKTLSIIFAVVVLAIPPQVLAGIRASFDLDSNAWHATHILLVETSGTAGVFTVKEVWKGNSELGSNIRVPELVPDPRVRPDPRRLPFGPGTDEFGVDEKIPKEPPGSKMVLFLKHRSESEVRAASSGKQHEWQPAYFGGMKVSAVWIERDKAFCFVQWMNPGPSAFGPCPNFRAQGVLTLSTLRQRVNEVLDLQDNLSKALAMENDGARLEALRKIVFADVRAARQPAIQQLGKSGPEAMPILRQIMDRPPVTYDSRDILAAFVEAAGKNAGPELKEWLEEDVAFWKAKRPSLEKGWWNQDAKPDAPLRVKYDETIEIVRSLDRLRYEPAASTAAQLRDVWRDSPLLNDSSGLSQMAKEADALAKHLAVVKSN